MDNTFIKIGQVIRKNEDESRIEYHPLLAVRNLTKKEIPISTIAIHELKIDMDNNTITFENTDAIYEKINIINYKLGETSNHGLIHLIGNDVIGLSPAKIKKGIKLSVEIHNQFSFEAFNKKYLNEYSKILTPSSFIYKYRVLIDANLEQIINKIKKYDDDKKILNIALVMNITYNGETKFAHEFTECLDEIDEMFLQASYVKDKGYIFTNAFYTMFNYGKFETNGINTMYEGSIPYYSKDDFLSLYYARSIYNEMSFYINNDYSISIFPNYDDLTMIDIKDLMFKGKDIFDFNKICSEIQNFIERKKKVDIKERIPIPIMLKFDIYYRYKLGEAGNQNMLRLTGVRYARLLKIRDHINNEYYPKQYNKETKTERKTPLYYILTDLYQNYYGKSDRYMTTIIHTLQNIYQEKYTVPQEAEFCLLDRSEHLARISNNEFRNTWNRLFNTYKFLKTMENQNFVSELTVKPSYKLGVELAKFEAGWKDGRENLRSAIHQFTGNISRTVYSVNDIRNYYQDLIQRMTRNKVFCGDHNDLISLMLTIKDDVFEKNNFIMGYFAEKNEYKTKIDKQEKVVEVNAKNNNDDLLELA